MSDNQSENSNVWMPEDQSPKNELPSGEQIWATLQELYGANIVGFTLVAVLYNKEHTTIHTTTFPKE